MSIDTDYKNIVKTDAGIPIIRGTTMKVVELVLNHKAYGWDPEALKENHPYLTMGQIYSALAYYWDHLDEMEQDIQRRLQRIDDLRQVTKPSHMRERVRNAGILE